MKKNSRKKLIALLCTFALGFANVEKSQAIFGILKKKNQRIAIEKNIKKKYENMWREGITEIYKNFYEWATKAEGLTFEIIDSDKFTNSDFTFIDPSKIDNFNPINNGHELIKKGHSNMSGTPFLFSKS